MSADPITDYLAQLRRRLRWRRHGSRVLAEIEDHLRAATAANEKQGMSREDAVRAAITSLGSPKDILDHARRRRCVVAVAALIGVALGVAVAVVQPWAGPSRATAGAGTTRHPAPTESSRQLVESIESGFSQSKIEAVTFGNPPPEYTGQTTGPWMYIQVPSVSGADSILGSWEANLLAAAYAAQARLVGLTPETGVFVGSSATCPTDPDSRSCDASGGPISEIPVGTTTPVAFDPTSASAASVRAMIQSGLGRTGLKLKSISIYTVDGHPAPVVVAESDHPVAVVAHPPTDAAVFGAEPNYFEGTYLELEDSQGTPVLVQGFASRMGSGVGYIEPKFQTPGG
jgi:hypothetical protein